ncbi:Crp/Fnr family transcriptional regulator [Candidatus Daviesbacteria bacterium]|nr:Crp/Fnr family transcriptional regulator [Candidatus Daviesbacteria bacterium]
MLSENISKKVFNYFQSSTITRFKKKDIVLHPEQNTSLVFSIKSGFARAYRISEDGDELTLMILKSGDIFPLAIGILSDHNNYYIEAITSLEVYSAKEDLFLSFVKSRPEIFYELMTDTLAQFNNLLARMENLVIGKAYSKVVSTLLSCVQSFGQKKGDNVILNLPLTHKDIANLAGITRETTCLEMKKLVNKGLISKSGKLFIVTNLKQLEEEVYEPPLHY